MPRPVKGVVFLPELCARKSPCEYKTRMPRATDATGRSPDKKNHFPVEGEVVRLAEGSGAIKQEPTAERERGHKGDERGRSLASSAFRVENILTSRESTAWVDCPMGFLNE